MSTEAGKQVPMACKNKNPFYAAEPQVVCEGGQLQPVVATGSAVTGRIWV